MSGIGRVGQTGGGMPVGGSNRAGQSGAGFAVGTGAAGPAVAAPPVLSLAALDGLLSLQEGQGGRAGDEPARRHAETLLDELAALQRRLLDGDADPALLRRLAALLRAVPAASDPGLRALLHAASLRAAVELARFGN